MNIDPRATILGIATVALGTLSGCGRVDDSRGMVTDIRVVVNELVPKNSATDDAGTSGDWVELYNSSDQPVNLRGCYVSDNPEKPLKFQLTSEAVIKSGGYLTLWADGIGAEPLHLPFGLGADGESFVLSNPDGRVIDSVDYVMARTDQAFARFPNGTGDFAWCDKPSRDADNGSSCLAIAK